MKFTPLAIKRLRQRLNLTQEEFAERIGVSSRSVAHWEAGTRNVSNLAQRVIERIAQEADHG